MRIIYNSNINNDNDDNVYSKIFNLFNDYYDIDKNNEEIKKSINELGKNIKNSINIKRYEDIDDLSDNLLNNFEILIKNYKDIKSKIKKRNIKNIFNDINF